MKIRTKDEQKAYLEGYEKCAECIRQYLSGYGKKKLEYLLVAVRNAVESEDKDMTDNNIKDILACLIKHIRPDGEFYPFTSDEVKKMKECLKPKTRHNCLSCKYFDKKKKLMQEYGCLKFTATIDDPNEEMKCYEEEVT